MLNIKTHQEQQRFIWVYIQKFLGFSWQFFQCYWLECNAGVIFLWIKQTMDWLSLITYQHLKHKYVTGHIYLLRNSGILFPLNMNTQTCTKEYTMRVNSTQYQVKVWIYLFLCPLDLILWFLSSWVKLWATSLWTIKFGDGNLNISLPVYHHCFVCLVGILWLANIVEQYGSTWDELASPD